MVLLIAEDGPGGGERGVRVGVKVGGGSERVSHKVGDLPSLGTPRVPPCHQLGMNSWKCRRQHPPPGQWECGKRRSGTAPPATPPVRRCRDPPPGPGRAQGAPSRRDPPPPGHSQRLCPSLFPRGSGSGRTRDAAGHAWSAARPGTSRMSRHVATGCGATWRDRARHAAGRAPGGAAAGAGPAALREQRAMPRWPRGRAVP